MQIEANGISINYRIDGNEDAPWVTLTTGIANDLTLWDSQVPALAEDFRILRFDTRGHGDSSATEGPYTLDLLVDDIGALWNGLGIAKSHLVGIGLGGVVAANLALAHPDRLIGVVLCACRATLTPEYAEIWPPLIERVLAGGIDSVVEPTTQRWFTEDFKATNADALDASRSMIGRTSLPGYLGCIGALLTLGYADDLHRLSVPTLFLSGGEDRLGGPSEVMQAMADLAPDARHEVVPGAGHIVNMGNPEGFNRALGRFLRGL